MFAAANVPLLFGGGGSLWQRKGKPLLDFATFAFPPFFPHLLTLREFHISLPRALPQAQDPRQDSGGGPQIQHVQCVLSGPEDGMVGKKQQQEDLGGGAWLNEG